VTQAGLGLAVAVTLTAIGWWTVARLPTTPDECWHLLVVRRTMQGRRLYRGIFFGAGPWSVWAARGIARRFGVRLLAMRRLTVLLSVALAAALAGWAVAVGTAWPVALAAAAAGALSSSVLWPVDNEYGLWSRLGAVAACAAAAAGAGGDHPAWWGVLAGAGLTVALTTKYTLGVAAALAVLATAVGESVLLVLVAGLVASVGAGTAYAVSARGGVGRTIAQRLVRNKTTFVAAGRFGFLSGWRAALSQPHESPATRWVSWWAYAATMLAAVLVVVDVVAGASSGSDQSARVATAGLALVGAAAQWPRADPSHVRNAAPLWLVAAIAVIERWSPGVGLAAGAAAGMVGLAALAAAVAERRRFSPPEPTGSPFDGVDPAPWRLADLVEAGVELRSLTGGTVFLLRPDAAVCYLATGLRNPTPYDYPLASPFGPGGQQQLAANLRSGRIAYCCWVPADAGALTPTVLEEAVAGLRVVAHTRAGTLVTGR